MTDGMVTVSRVRRVGERGRGEESSFRKRACADTESGLDWGRERAAELGWELKELAWPVSSV